MIKTNTVHKLMLLALPMLMLAGCGSGSPAPLGSTISISPATLDVKGQGTSAACTTYNPTTSKIVYTSFTVTVLGSNSRPVASVDVNYSLDFTTETATSEYQRIYLGPLSGPIVGEPPNRLLGAGTLKTNLGGIVELVVGTLQDCNHFGDLTVKSGSASSKSVITVTGP